MINSEKVPKEKIIEENYYSMILSEADVEQI